jgi:hypothetical protein
MKNLIISISLVFLSLISLSASVLSYWRLDRVPYGFHVDELAGSVDIGCLSTEGVDAHNVPYPLFSNLNYGTPKPPTFIYPGIVWARVFGYSVASLRALTVTVHLLGIAGLFFLGQLLFGRRYAILTMTLGLLSPWTWGLSRVAFESLFAATFLIWGIYFFLRSPKIWSVLLSGLFFIAAIYSYPPFRLQTPLMLLSLIIYTHRKNCLWPLKSWLVFLGALIVPAIPLIHKTLSGEIQQRFNGISIFSKDYLNSIHSQGHFTDIAGIFINNFLLHFNGDFLFLRGDPSYVHSTRHFGILSWLDMAALLLLLIWTLFLLVKKYRKNNPLVIQKSFVLFLIINILIGVLPAAMTNSELPNSLRITGAWPFVCLLSGFLLWQACERWWGIWVGTCILSVVFAVMFFNIYFGVFPQEGKGMFGYWTLDEANQLRTDEDWMKFVLLYRYQDYNARYFLMQYRHLSCTQARNTWENMRDLLQSRGIYY